jgi:hypothetical protein
MRVTLAVRPKVTVNRESPPWYMLRKWCVAVHWLGARYLCHKPINRKIEHA